jgi:hypothetical protein
MECAGCGLPFSNLPRSAFISIGDDLIHNQYGSWPRPDINHPSSVLRAVDSELGRNTFFWYRIYTGVMAALYVAVAGLGIMLMLLPPETAHRSEPQMLIMGGIYAVIGTIFFVVNLIATLLPPKPYNWIVGIVMIALGMTSCCLWPAVIPLLIYWVKPETKAFFGRK